MATTTISNNVGMNLSYELSEDDLASAADICWAKHEQAWWALPAGRFLVVFLAALLGLCLISRSVYGWGLAPALVFLIGYPKVWKVMTVATLRRQLRLEEPTTLRMTEEHMELAMPEVESCVGWGKFHRWAEGPRHFLLYLSPITFYIVPRRAVTDEDKFYRFLVDKIGSQ